MVAEADRRALVAAALVTVALTLAPRFATGLALRARLGPALAMRPLGALL